MNAEVVASYRCAEDVARRRARNFYYSFVVLPPAKRRALCAVYAFMRFCDDISDGSAEIGDKRKSLAVWRNRLDAAARGELDGSPILPAFHHTLRTFSIPAEYFHWIIDGAEMDLTRSRYESFEDLYQYCFHVASAVGLVCLQIFGFKDDRAPKLAEQCGIAFQLTNILRDIKEDAAMGRIYLPGEELQRFHLSDDDLRAGVRDGRFLELMAFQSQRASGYYARARGLLPLVESDSRAALWAMMEIYERLLGKIVRCRFDVFGRRIRLSSAEKATIAVRALFMRFLKI